MDRKLKKLLFTFLLFPIFPIVSIPENGDGESNNDDGNAGNDNDDSNGKNDNNVDDNVNDGRITFDNQQHLDRIISKRVNAAVKSKQKEWEDNKAKEKMSETELLRKEKTEAENKMNAAMEKANKMLLKANVMSKCTELNIIDSDAAFALMDTKDIENDDGNFTGIEESLKNLIAKKPWLVKDNNNSQRTSGDDQNNSDSLSKNKKKSNVNNLLRKMAGY